MVDGFAQALRVPAVTVVGGDVEIAQQHQPGAARELGGQPLTQRCQPRHLVGELVGVRRLAVDEIAVDHTHIARRRGQRSGNHAGLLIRKSRDVLHHIGHRRPGQQRDAVVGFLPQHRAVITGSLQGFERKLVVAELELLQAQDVHRKPVQNLRQPDSEGVDVPGGNFHDFWHSASVKWLFVAI